MKLLKYELNDKMRTDVFDKVLECSSYASPVRNQIRKHFGLWENDGLIKLKVNDPQWYIRNDLDETD